MNSHTTSQTVKKKRLHHTAQAAVINEHKSYKYHFTKAQINVSNKKSGKHDLCHWG